MIGLTPQEVAVSVELKDYYDVLGVARNAGSGAIDADILVTLDEVLHGATRL